MATETIIWLIPLPPLLAFFLIWLFTNRSKALSHTIGVGAAALSWLGSMIVFFRAVGTAEFGKNIFASAINWLPTGDSFFKIGVQIDPVSAATLFFVSITIFMIFLYSVGYHNFGQPKGDHDKPGLPPHGPGVPAVRLFRRARPVLGAVAEPAVPVDPLVAALAVRRLAAAV